MRTTIRVETTYTTEDIEYVLFKVERGEPLTRSDVQALIYGSQKWVDFKKECNADPSYQWGYGHIYY